MGNSSLIILCHIMRDVFGWTVDGEKAELLSAKLNKLCIVMYSPKSGRMPAREFIASIDWTSTIEYALGTFRGDSKESYENTGKDPYDIAIKIAQERKP
jgi:hypothetical protein